MAYFISYTQPDELVDFALAYFTRLKAKRNAIAAENNNLSDESMLSEDEEFGECSTQTQTTIRGCSLR